MFGLTLIVIETNIADASLKGPENQLRQRFIIRFFLTQVQDHSQMLRTFLQVVNVVLDNVILSFVALFSSPSLGKSPLKPQTSKINSLDQVRHPVEQQPQ